MTSKMRAVRQTQYGPPARSLVYAEDVPRPKPEPTDILLKVHASSLTKGDWHLLYGKPFFIRPMFGNLFSPKLSILGADVAGVVVEIGESVTKFKVGDKVWGDTSDYGFGAWADYCALPENALCSMPEGVSFNDVGGLAVGALSALRALRDFGKVEKGHRVLIVGAASGVGSMAVQIAHIMGANVTAVVRGSKKSVLDGLHVETILDSDESDIAKTALKFDVIVDCASYRKILDYQPVLNEGGTYVIVGGSGGNFLKVAFARSWLSKRMGGTVCFLDQKERHEDLEVVKNMVENDGLKVVIDRIIPLADVPKGMQALENREVKGRIIVGVCEGDSEEERG